MKRSALAAVAALVLLCGLCVPVAFGQAVYGSILGTVTDPSGAAVANAKVTATSQTKNTSVEATTNESGNYSVTHLIPDVYSVRVEGQGFKNLSFKDILVQADTGVRVDGQFQVGGSSETIEVTSEAPQLKTDRADVSIEFTGKQLAELPLYNRNFQSLELLSPGTQILGWGHAATENPQGSKQIFVNGQHFSGTGYELDGTDNQDPILGIIIVNPSLDAVTETKITTQNYDAEFGKALAGIMTAQTKSGSNEIHGTGYFYDLDPVDPARNPFTGQASPNNWKQYGGAVGGPIIKNKLFFFGDYEGTRRTSGTTFTTSVPTALVRSTCLDPTSGVCDLSEFLGNVPTGNGQVYDPYQAAGARTLYSGNVINQSVLQANDANCASGCSLTTAEAILAQLPAPNLPGDHNGTLNNYGASGSGSFNDYQYVIRGDYTANEKLSIFGRYTHSNFKLSGKPVFGAIGGPGLGYLGLAGQSLINNYSLATGFNYTLSSTLLTDFRFGYFRYNPHSTKFDQSNASAASDLGFPGLNTSDVTTNGLPGLFFDAVGAGNGGFGNLGEALNITRCNCPLIEKEQGEQFVNNWTKIFGNHQVKFGADLRHATNLRVPSDANRTGQMHFNWQGTSDGNGNGGVDLATFLFSEVSNMDRYVGSATEPNAIETQNRYFFYAQDTWRATHKLTVNYGLRWEHYTPEFVNGKGNGGFAVLPEGVIRVAGYGGISDNGSTASNWKLFAPRVGIAYEVNSKTVVRMGYGRSFDIGVFGSLFGHTVTQNLPVLAHQTLNSATFDNKTPAYNFTGQCLASPFDPTICGPASGSAAFPVIPSNGILPYFGVCPESVAIAGGPCQGSVQPHTRPDKLVVPSIDAWNVTVQRQLTSKTSVDVAYVANHGSHVFKGTGPSYNANQATIAGCVSVGCSTTTGSLSFAARSPYNTAFSTPYTYADGFTTNVVCCEGNGFDYRGNDGVNSYKALQIKVDHRASFGLTLNGSYTYSRANDNDGGYQPDLRQGNGREDFNRDSVLILTSIYELPFGRGKTFLGNSSRAMDLLVGGWQWNATMVIGSGLPFSPSYQNCGLDRDTGPCRPDLSGSFHMGSGSFNNQTHQVVYFTPVATMCDDPVSCGTVVTTSGPFSDPGIGNFGNVRRNQFTGPGEFLSDMSIFKNFTITERVHAQFQAEFFNVFNHPVYANPNSCIDCSSGGLITGLEANSLMRQMQLGFRVSF